jgi:hypothetical protein
MNDIPQLKDDLLLEIDYLRGRLRRLEEDLAKFDGDASAAWEELNPREERRPFEGTFTFSGDFDEVEARGVDLSSGGVCFEIGGDLPFSLQVRQGEEVIERSASLAWAQRLGDGKCRFGFEFTDDPTDDDLG